MAVHSPTQIPSSWSLANKQDVRLQMGALCYRVVKDKPQILLITSRDSGRWLIPKGWPMQGQSLAQSARTEAWEEAGVEGKSFEFVLGMYGYQKAMDDGNKLHCIVSVYPVKVKRLVDDFPEAGQRRRKWFSPKKAASKVDEADLSQLLRNFDPRRLRR